jgi:hypothetical protein
MKLIIPTTITDAYFTSTNVDETISTLWSSGSTYADGDFVYLATGTQRDIYESLQDSNTNKNPATETDWWVFRSTTYDEYSAVATYAEDDIVIDATAHKVYQSLQGSNTGNALTDILWWIEISSTNPWKAFDAKINSQTERTGSIYYELEPGIIEGISFFNVDANSIDIVLTDPTEGEVYNETIDLINTENVFDGYSYCFAPILTTDTTFKTDIPPYGSATLEITISAASDSEIVKIGEIVLGRMLQFGESVEYGANFQIKDFSIKTQDDFGNYTITERSYSNKINYNLVVENELISYLKQILEDYRATPLVCIPTEAEFVSSPLVTYGYYKDAKTSIDYFTHSILTITWEGLI